MIQYYLALSGIEIDGVGQQNLSILLSVQQDAQRSRDFAGGQRSRGYLIQEWLKQMEVTAVDQCDIKLLMAQRSSGIQSAEAPAEEDQPMHLSYIDAFNPASRLALT